VSVTSDHIAPFSFLPSPHPLFSLTVPLRLEARMGLESVGLHRTNQDLLAKMKERRQGVILNDIGNSCERTDYNYVAGSSGNAYLVALTRCLVWRV